MSVHCCLSWDQMTQHESSRGASRQLPESMAASREAQAPGEPSHTLVMDNETMIEVGWRIWEYNQVQRLDMQRVTHGPIISMGA